jgi:hypothetical protein
MGDQETIERTGAIGKWGGARWAVEIGGRDWRALETGGRSRLAARIGD